MNTNLSPRHRRPSALLGPALGITALVGYLGLLAPAAEAAAVVTPTPYLVNLTDGPLAGPYVVRILPFGTFDDNSTAITSSNNLVWGNELLAAALASSPETIAYGPINTDVFGTGDQWGALFSYEEGPDDTNIYALWSFEGTLGTNTLVPAGGTPNDDFNGFTFNYHYATAELPLLPRVEPDGSFIFALDGELIIPGEMFWIDPEPAIGFDYVATNALFQSVQGPIFPDQTTPYGLYGSNDSCGTGTFTEHIAYLDPGVTHTFSAPVECFAIRNIAMQVMVDPTDPLGFATGVSLTTITGNPVLSQTPVTRANGSTGVPAPLPIFGATMALGWSRRLRSRLKAARSA